MINILIIADQTESIKELTARLIRNGLYCSVANDAEQAFSQAEDRSPDLILVDMNNPVDMQHTMDIYSQIRIKKPLLMVVVPEAMLGDIADNIKLTDFMIKPYEISELFVRIQRLVRKIRNTDSKKIIKRGDLEIDTVSCEVSIDSRLIELTFKEYELLRFLAASEGQVFTREALLNKVWKYDFLGGERTVDVHIRRLRSKIEDADHKFIDTIRSIGYRFRKDA